MHKLYGTDGVQESPPPSSFPLLGLESKSVVLLDEWRFNEKILSLATQLLWYEGKPLPVARPQNQAGVAGHSLYQGTAPIFVTTKSADLERIQHEADWARQHGVPSEHTMLLRRLKVYMLQVATPTPGDTAIRDCGVCFARMALRWSRRASGDGGVDFDDI